MENRPVVASYLLAAVGGVVVLYFHLLAALFSGLAVYVLVRKLARRLPTRWGRKTHAVALIGIILLVVLAVSGIALGLWLFIQGHEGVAALLPAVADRLENLKQSLPPYLSSSIPDTVEDLRGEITQLLKEHSSKLSHAGLAWGRTIAHVLLGLVIGSIASLHRFRDGGEKPPLGKELRDRLLQLADSFDKVVFAQLKISALNTTLTTIYLLGILPLCGVHLPMRTLLILLTFVTGLLPVVGNLISNSVIVLISFGVSAGVGLGSIGFLLFIHKLEYFTNAKIVGGEVQAGSWELLSAMVVFEAVFGLSGLIAAPVFYAWLKSELKAKAMV